MVAGAVDPLAGNGDIAVTVVGGALVHHVLLQRRCQRQDLKGGAGLIGVVEGFVAPLAQLGVGQRELPLLHRLLQRPVPHGGKIVEVVVGIGGHAQDGAGVHVHHHAAGALGRVKLVHQFGKAALQIILDGGVQRQHQVVSVFRVVIFFVGVEHVVAHVVPGRDHKARLALQLLLIAGLQAVKAGVVRAHKAHDMGGQGAVGIVSLGISDQIHAVDVVLLQKGTDLVGQRFLRPQLEHLVLGVGALHLLVNALRVQIQDPGQVIHQQVRRPGGVLFLQLLRQLQR